MRFLFAGIIITVFSAQAFSQSITLDSIPPGPSNGSYYYGHTLKFTWSHSSDITYATLFRRVYSDPLYAGDAQYLMIRDSLFSLSSVDTFSWSIHDIWREIGPTDSVYFDFLICGYKDTMFRNGNPLGWGQYIDSAVCKDIGAQIKVKLAPMLSNLTIANGNAKIGDSLRLSWTHTNIAGVVAGEEIPHDSTVRILFSYGSNDDPESWKDLIDSLPNKEGLNTGNLFLDCRQGITPGNLRIKLILKTPGDFYNDYSVSEVQADSACTIESVVSTTPVIRNARGTIGSTDPLVDRNLVNLSYDLQDPDFLNGNNDVVTVSFSDQNGKETIASESKGYTEILDGCKKDDSITINAADKFCKKASVTIPLTRVAAPSNKPIWGYQANTHGYLDSFKDMKVYVKIDTTRRPSTSNGVVQKDSVIRSAIALGLNVWASVLDSSMNWQWEYDPSKANFFIEFGTCFNCGGRSGGFTIEEPLLIAPEKRGFRQLDLASPKKKYERDKAIYINNKDSLFWCIWTNTLPEGYLNNISLVTWKTASDTLSKWIRDDTNPEYLKHNRDAHVVLDGKMINDKSFPYDNIFGKGEIGDGDIMLIMQHEFGHMLMGTHDDYVDKTLYPELVKQPSCMFFSANQSEISRIDEDTLFIDSTKYVARGGLRLHPDTGLGITDSFSPGALLGNTWSRCWVGGRGVFDLDADRLASGSVWECDCEGDSTGLNWGKKPYWGKRPYKIIYPEIRNGWKIIMRNCIDTNWQIELTNWHEAQDSMGWVHSNDARDAKWYLYDIFNPDLKQITKAERYPAYRRTGKKNKGKIKGFPYK